MRTVFVLVFAGVAVTFAAQTPPRVQAPTVQRPTVQQPTVQQPTVQQPQTTVPTVQTAPILAPVGSPLQTSQPAGQAFEGTWSASGQRQSLMTELGRPAVTVQLSGAVSITTGTGLGRGFRGEAIGFDDGGGLAAGSAVWTDDRGDRIFSVIQGATMAAAGRQVHGTITGGSGRYAGVTGEYEFTWQHLITTEGNAVNGRAVDLRGRVQPGTGAR